jgi:hypothetical protein
MTNNPFLSKTFTSIWLKYFQNDRPVHNFDSIEKVSFTKNKYLPLYTNLGENITNGMFYNLKTDTDAVDFKHKVFLIHDVPSYFNIDSAKQKGHRLKLKKVGQYKGFLSELTHYDSVEAYKKVEFTTKNRYSINRKRKRLEASFNIRFKVYHGDISKEEFQSLFSTFKILLESRFDDLKKENDVVKTWDYYYELAYEMILNKKAVLAVVYNGDEPISLSLNFMSEDIMFFAVTSYNTDYNKFSLGYASIEYLIDWCCKNGVKTFDMSKGVYIYKISWSNKEYNFENHILYDSSSIVSSAIAIYLSNYFKLKQYLRDKEINILYSKLKFFFKPTPKDTSINHYTIEEIPIDIKVKSDSIPIDFNTNDYAFLKPAIYDVLYKSPQLYSSLKIFELDTLRKSYLIVCDKKNYKITMD